MPSPLKCFLAAEEPLLGPTFSRSKQARASPLVPARLDISSPAETLLLARTSSCPETSDRHTNQGTQKLRSFPCPRLTRYPIPLEVRSGLYVSRPLSAPLDIHTTWVPGSLTGVSAVSIPLALSVRGSNVDPVDKSVNPTCSPPLLCPRLRHKNWRISRHPVDSYALPGT